MPNQPDGQPVRSWGTLIAGSDGTLGQIIKTDSDGDLQVDVLSIAPGTGATALGKAEDAAHTSGDVGVMLLGVRNDNGDSLTGATLDYTPIATAPSGAVQIAGSGNAHTDGASIATVAGIRNAAGTEGSLAVSAGLYNGATVDRPRGNVAGTLLASAARTATTSSADQTNYNGQAVAVTFNITAVPGVETLTLTIEAKDPVSGTYTTLLTGVAQSGTGTTRLRVGTNITASANVAAADVLGRTWRVTVTHSAAGSFTYSVGFDVVTA